MTLHVTNRIKHWQVEDSYGDTAKKTERKILQDFTFLENCSVRTFPCYKCVYKTNSLFLSLSHSLSLSLSLSLTLSLPLPLSLSLSLSLFYFLNLIREATLNHAARHRNVYLDTLGADPYGKSSQKCFGKQYVTITRLDRKFTIMVDKCVEIFTPSTPTHNVPYLGHACKLI